MASAIVARARPSVWRSLAPCYGRGVGTSDDFRRRARATWAAGDWDSCARLIEPVGAVVLDRIDLRPGLDLVDVGTGTGGSVAIPAARRGANVVGLDITPELFEHARRRAAEARVEIEWVEGTLRTCPSPTKASTA